MRRIDSDEAIRYATAFLIFAAGVLVILGAVAFLLDVGIKT